MRRYYRNSQSPPKPFIHTYHINEVPLPYYNPLQDPYLQGFFQNRNVSQHIQSVGIAYRPRNQYPYQQRRTKNFNKFLRINSHIIPSNHIIKNREKSKLKQRNYYSDCKEDSDITRSQLLLKKMSDSQLSKKGVKDMPSFLTDILSKRPLTQRTTRAGMQSEEGRSRGVYFKQRNISSSKEEMRQRQVIV